MKIQVIATAQQCGGFDFSSKTVAVIDVLRATSVITTALSNGARAVIPTASIEEARTMYQNAGAGQFVLGGERDAVKIDGFHKGNSPLEYSRDEISDKTLILSTTNGTLAIKAAESASRVIALSFLNITAVAEYLSKQIDDLVIICAGTAGQFSLDDALCAGMLISMIGDRRAVETDDLGKLVLQFYGSENGNINDKLAGCKHVQYLQSKGYQADIDYCLQTGLLQVIPVLKNGKLVRACG